MNNIFINRPSDKVSLNIIKRYNDNPNSQWKVTIYHDGKSDIIFNVLYLHSTKSDKTILIRYANSENTEHVQWASVMLEKLLVGNYNLQVSYLTGDGYYAAGTFNSVTRLNSFDCTTTLDSEQKHPLIHCEYIK